MEGRILCENMSKCTVYYGWTVLQVPDTEGLPAFLSVLAKIIRAAWGKAVSFAQATGNANTSNN